MKLKANSDPQKHRVYEAESRAGAHESRQFIDIAECADWIRACLDTGLVDQDYPTFRTFVYKTNDPGVLSIRERRKTKSQAIAHATLTDLAFTKEALHTWIAVHELAHMVAGRCLQANGHGWQFCEVYLKLVGWFIGYKEQTILREEFDTAGVAYSKPALPQWMGARVGGGA